MEENPAPIPPSQPPIPAKYVVALLFAALTGGGVGSTVSIVSSPQ
jgi:hypothetical protein